MKNKIKADWADTRLLFRCIPATVATLFAVSVVMMNLLANKTIYQSAYLALDGGILVSWLSFLCMDVVTKAFGPKAATKLSVFAIFVNLIACLFFYLVSIIPTKDDFSSFNQTVGGTWFILLSSTIAFLCSACINNFMNWGIGRSFKRDPDGKLAFFTRCYVSTFLGQFFDNFIFAILTFTVFAPIFWDGFSWTYLQCFTCSLLGAGVELFCEAVFSPLGYRIVRRWEREGIAAPYHNRDRSNEQEAAV
ncbi:MAG: VUT family protein [Clostridia bacterium]|nr:VUT family protein [Clostridia bacterium]